MYLFILLQGGPPDPGQWGDPDVLPIDQHLYLLALAGIILTFFVLMRSSTNVPEKHE